LRIADWDWKFENRIFCIALSNLQLATRNLQLTTYYILIESRHISISDMNIRIRNSEQRPVLPGLIRHFICIRFAQVPVDDKVTEIYKRGHYDGNDEFIDIINDPYCYHLFN